MSDAKRLAELLFGDIHTTPEDYEAQYPPRALPQGARVTRFAPSPTGFLHIGNLYTAYVNQLTAQVSGGVFLLRIEDTDKKREVEHGVQGILDGLSAFGVCPQEGMLREGLQQGDYGPYRQSDRKDIYQSCAKRLVEEGLAYPCFCTAEELDMLRTQQEQAGVNKGYYGKWAGCRKLSFAEQEERIRAGVPYTLRLKGEDDLEKRIQFTDMVRGKLEMPQNHMDAVLLKTDGMPTYHFAHAVDDHFMRVSHVIRSDEWIASVPLHLALFRACGFKPPQYAHISPLMKEENGNKRKLSKRKDPEAAVRFFVEAGYPQDSVLEYCMTLINSNFEDWRRANPQSARTDFPFNLKKMSASGALFDLVKLQDISKNRISTWKAQDVSAAVLAWAEQFDPQFAALLRKDTAYATAIFNIDREGKKPRKDIATWAQVKEYIAYFYEELFRPDYSLPQQLAAQDAAAIVQKYAEVYQETDDRDAWFTRIKALCLPLGFCPNVKEYKQDPQAFRGHVGDVSTVIRVAITGRQNTPDLYAILQLLGRQRVRDRLLHAQSHYRSLS